MHNGVVHGGKYCIVSLWCGNCLTWISSGGCDMIESWDGRSSLPVSYSPLGVRLFLGGREGEGEGEGLT